MSKKKTNTQEKVMDIKMEAEEVITPEYMGKELATGKVDYSSLPVETAKAYECRDKMINAVRSSEKAYMDLAAGLYEAFVNQEKYCAVWGMNFSEFAESQLGIGEGRAYMLKDIGAFVADPKNAVTVEMANSIGWTKMSVLVTAAKKNKELPVSSLVEEAKSLKVKELQDLVRGKHAKPVEAEEDYGVEGKEKSDMKETAARDAKNASLKLALVYESDQADFVREAIGYAANELNLDTEDRQTASKAIEHICTNWLEMKNVSPAGLEVNDWIKYIQKKYNVKLVRVVEEESLESALGGFEAIQEEKRAEMTLEQMLDEDEALKELAGITAVSQ